MLTKGLGWCSQDGCENPFEVECQRCGIRRCRDHVATCRECHLLANFPERFCFNCAQTHEATKYMRGQCVDQYQEEFSFGEGGDFRSLMMRRIERYAKMGKI